MSHHSPLYVIILSVLLLAVGLPAQAEPHATANLMPTIVRVDLVHTGLGSAVTDIQPVPGQPTWLLIVLKDGEVRLSINGVLQVNPYLTVNPSTSSATTAPKADHIPCPPQKYGHAEPPTTPQNRAPVQSSPHLR